MDPFFSYLLYLILFSMSLLVIFLVNQHKSPKGKLPPGKMGCPIVGETIQYALAARRGNPEGFMNYRMNNYSADVFKTSLMGENMAVLCGASGNKFLFSNENKIVTSWWPRSLEKVLLQPTLERNASTKPSSSLLEFLKPEALKRYIGIMDSMAREHIDIDWAPHREVKVFPLSKKYTFSLSCRLFMNLKDPEHVARLSRPYNLIMAGLLSLPIDIPGTAFNRAIKAANIIHGELAEIIKKRKMELVEKRDPAARDLLSLMLLTPDENGTIVSDVEISTHILLMLLASHETTCTLITFVLKYLTEFPDIYNEVLKEQMEIAKTKGPGELLNWSDIQKMKYSWNVAKESMRLSPPAPGAFREAITDFTYAGFTIPKGWKTHWTVHTTHKDPKYFPNPEKFDLSRFEGKGSEPYTYVPFGGGPRMCPGREYARLEVLVFLYNLVTRLKWEKADPNEKIKYNPSPVPTKGFPVRLQPLEKKLI